jgi:hypothetical protein
MNEWESARERDNITVGNRWFKTASFAVLYSLHSQQQLGEKKKVKKDSEMFPQI